MPECPYCGEEFESEHKEGVHRSKEHVNEDNITRKKQTASKGVFYKNSNGE
ncbi:MAG: hypothetical protein H8Z69_03865 [Nanohaloarchaea archaeon]|nr:hypothetical protein [Candidatus Nanohaloarchaea archaeon]